MGLVAPVGLVGFMCPVCEPEESVGLIGLVGLMFQPWVFLEFSGFVRGDPKLFQNESIDFCQKVSPGLTTGLCLRGG